MNTQTDEPVANFSRLNWFCNILTVYLSRYVVSCFTDIIARVIINMSCCDVEGFNARCVTIISFRF